MSFKVADYKMSNLIGVLAFLVQNMTSKRYFFTGLCVGLAAFLAVTMACMALRAALELCSG